MYSMVNKKSDVVLAVGRQLMHLATMHNSISKGISELRKIADSDQQRIINSLEIVFLSDSDSDNNVLEKSIGPYRVFQKIISKIKQEGGDPINMFPGFDKMLFTINDQMRGLWVSLREFFFYALSVLLVAGAIFTILLIFVLPQFDEMFSSFGEKLPLLTEWMIKNDAVLFYSVFLALTGIIVFMIFIVFHMFNITMRMMPLNSNLRKVPFMRKLVTNYNRLLALNYARLFISSGLSGDRSLLAAADMANDQLMGGVFIDSSLGSQQSDPVLSALTIAKKAGNLESEIDYQINDQSYQLINDFNLARQKSVFIGHALIGIFVGLIVAGMYLPIFKMGALG